MNKLTPLKVWFHGGVFTFTLSWLYFLTMLFSLLFTTLLESLLFIVVAMLIVLPMICGFINQIISKCVWNTKINLAIIKLWGGGLLFILLFFISNYIMINIGITDTTNLIINFVCLSFIYGTIGKYLITSQSSISQKSEGGK